MFYTHFFCFAHANAMFSSLLEGRAAVLLPKTHVFSLARRVAELPGFYFARNLVMLVLYCLLPHGVDLSCQANI